MCERASQERVSERQHQVRENDEVLVWGLGGEQLELWKSGQERESEEKQGGGRQAGRNC